MHKGIRESRVVPSCVPNLLKIQKINLNINGFAKKFLFYCGVNPKFQYYYLERRYAVTKKDHLPTFIKKDHFIILLNFYL